MTSDLKGISLLVFALALFLGACSENTHDRDFADPVAGSTVDFNYISVRDGRIRTLHEISYEIKVSGDFALTKSTSRVDQFNGTPYKISLAAFIGIDSALMIHAEKVADSSGASDYSNLPQERNGQTKHSARAVMFVWRSRRKRSKESMICNGCRTTDLSRREPYCLHNTLRQRRIEIRKF